MFFGLIEKYKSLKSDYLSLTPREKWKVVRNALSVAFSCIGLKVFDPNFELRWYSYISAFTCVYAMTLFPYTIWYYISEPIKALSYTPYLAILIPAMISFTMVMTPRRLKKARSLHTFAGDYIYLDNEKHLNPNYIRACDRSAIKLLKDSIKIVLIEVGSFIVVVMFAAYASLQSGKIHFAIPIVVPFTNLDSATGIIINTLSQLLLGYEGMFGTIGIELAICILKNTIWATIATICTSIDELSEAMESPQPIPERIIICRFKNILIQVQDYGRLMQEVSDLYYWKFLVQPYLLTLGVSMSIFLYLYGVWESGLGAAVLCYSELYVLCDIGNAVDLAVIKPTICQGMDAKLLFSILEETEIIFELQRIATKP